MAGMKISSLNLYLTPALTQSMGHASPQQIQHSCALQAVVNFPHMGSELWAMPDFVMAALRRVDAHRDFQEAGPTPTTQAGLRWREVRCHDPDPNHTPNPNPNADPIPNFVPNQTGRAGLARDTLQ